MKKRLLSLFLALAVCLSLAVPAAASGAVTPQQAYEAMIALKSQYPEGMPWTNDNYYGWHGGIYSGGYGCAGFAFLLSDAAFGELPARMLTEFAFEDVRVGDILRMNSDTHSVIVLETNDGGVVIAEGNYNNSIHWGRTLTKDEVLSSDYIMTRYPEDTGETEAPAEPPAETPVETPTEPPVETPVETPTEPSVETPVETPTETPTQPSDVSFPDVGPTDWFYQHVMACAGAGIVGGFSDGTFQPNEYVTSAQFLTMMTRIFCPDLVELYSDIPGMSWYYPYVTAAADVGMSDSLASADINDVTGMTRNNMAVVLYNILSATGYSISSAEMANAAASIPDLDPYSPYYTAVATCYAQGILGGMSDGSFCGGESMTRAQACTVIVRMVLLMTE